MLDDTAHSGTDGFALIIGSAARKRSPSVSVSEKCKRRKLNQSGNVSVLENPTEYPHKPYISRN